MKNYIKKLFSFSRKELNGVLVLSGLLFLLIIAKPLVNWLVPPPVADLSDFDSKAIRFLKPAATDDAQGADGVASAAARPRSQRGRSEPGPLSSQTDRNQPPRGPAAAAGNKTHKRFLFDPNTVSLTELLQLGLESKVARTLLNFRKAGGRFYKEEDLMKVYGLDSTLYKQLQPYIRIAAQQSRASYKKGKAPPASHAAVRTVIALNTADSTALLPLPGIGPVLSARIVKYRERLGGFYSVNQLLEVYGLDTGAFHRFRSRLRVDTAQIKKININTAGYRELMRLPYWSPNQVRILLNYRLQHGRFSSLHELHKIRALEKRIIQKVMPYLSLENTNQ